MMTVGTVMQQGHNMILMGRKKKKYFLVRGDDRCISYVGPWRVSEFGFPQKIDTKSYYHTYDLLRWLK